MGSRSNYLDENVSGSVPELFRKEEARSELLVNYARIAISFLYMGAILGVRHEVPLHSVIASLSGGIFSLLYSLYIFLLPRIGGYRPRVKYLSTTVDLLILSLAIWSFGTFRSFKTVAFLLYFLWIALGAMRFSVKLTAFAGLLSVGLYTGIAAQGLLLGSVQAGSITQSFTTPMVSPANIALQILFMSAFSFISIYVAKGYHMLVARSVELELHAEKERHEKNYVKDAFSRYVTHQVADIILEKGITLSGERRHATVLFCDIRDFTGMSERMEPEEVVGFLNEYLSLMIDVIFEFGGTLDKFVGDEIMAVFGVPVAREDDEWRAVSAAVRMREILAELNDRREKEGKDSIRFGIGIHSGDVVAGNIGSEKRMEYTVIGTTVNIASRIQNLNKVLQSDILITEETFGKVKELVHAEKQPPVRVRGIRSSLNTYRVISLQKSA